MENPKFKYYRRGTGELDTSNFPEIVEAKCVEVHHLDSRTIVSLALLQMYMQEEHFHLWCGREDFEVIVTGYVSHMRADKDLFDPSIAYDELGFTFDVRKVQHDSRNGIQSAEIGKFKVVDDLMQGNLFKASKYSYANTTFVGADSSVHKFFPDVDVEARKVRENGKVVSLDLDVGFHDHLQGVVIVDDILGGGATIQMCVDKIKESGYTGDIFLWTEWNEGIHPEEFLEQFTGYFIGENIYGVN